MDETMTDEDDAPVSPLSPERRAAIAALVEQSRLEGDHEGADYGAALLEIDARDAQGGGVMDETIGTIRVLGCKAKRLSYRAAEAETPIGTVQVRHSREAGWHAVWQAGPSVRVDLGCLAPSATAAAREATRRLRAIQRTCARAAAREEA